MRESEFFALLAEHIVTIHILQGIDAVRARSHALDDKAATAIGTAYTQHRLGLEGRIGMICVKTYQNTLDRLQILRFEHISRHLHRIDNFAGSETVGIVSHRIALVIIADGIGEVDGIGSIRLERIYQRNLNMLARSLDFRHFELRRRNNHFLGRIIYLDIFVEIDIHLLLLHIYALVGWQSSNHLRRSFVEPATIRLSHLGTGCQHEES